MKKKPFCIFLEPLDETEELLNYLALDSSQYLIGKYGAFVVAVVRCKMGGGIYGAHNVVAAALRTLRPRGIINVGVAFGRDSKKQHLGDVLVSHKVISYESSRVGTDKDGKQRIEFRGNISENQSKHLFRAFGDGADGWKTDEFGGDPVVRAVAILSGHKLVDNEEFKLKLFEDFVFVCCSPYCIGVRSIVPTIIY